MARHRIDGTDQGDNLLQQDARNDLIFAYGGFDNIHSGAGDDLIYAGADMDYVIAGDGNDRALGGDGSDVLNGAAGQDTLLGEAGADILIGGTGADWLYGGEDDNSLYSNGGSSGFEDKHLYGGTGNDRLVFAWNDGGVAAGGDGLDTLNLTVYDGSGPPWEGVTVSLSTGSGTATFGSYVLAISGIEVLEVQTWIGDDSVTSGSGNDVISVHRGANVVQAGAGDDRVVWHTGSANVLNGQAGLDTLELSHTVGLPGLVFSAAGGVVTDGYGSSLLEFEQFVVRGASAADHAVLGDGADQFFGQAGDDTGSGGDGHDWLMGQAGNDVLAGQAGADALNGGGGDDVLAGGGGDDTLTGQFGSDLMEGGAGADRFRFRAPEQYYDQITDFTVGVDKLVFYRGYLGLTFDDQTSDPGFLAFNGPDAAHGQFVYFEFRLRIAVGCGWHRDQRRRHHRHSGRGDGADGGGFPVAGVGGVTR